MAARRTTRQHRRRPSRAVAAAWIAAGAAAIGVMAVAAERHAPALPADPSKAELATLVGSLDRQHRLLDAIAQCESRGQPTVVSPDGRYGGLFQFDAQTWSAMGGQGRPADAPGSEQRVRAQRLLEARGLVPWPRCGPLAAARTR